MIFITIIISYVAILIFNNYIYHKIQASKRKGIFKFLYIVPYLLFSIFFYRSINNSSSTIFPYIGLSLFFSTLFIAIQKNEIKALMEHKDFLKAMPPMPLKRVMLEIVLLLIAVLVQEMYYKLVVLSGFMEFEGTVLAAVSTSVLFALDHYANPGSKKHYVRRDYILQFFACFLSCILFILSGCFWVGLIIHLVYNIFISALWIWRYLLSRQ